MKNSTPLYTDRDYLDEKFEEINVQLVNINKVLNGNGKKGLIEKVDDTAEQMYLIIRAFVILCVFVVVTHLQQATEFIIELFKHRM